MIEYDKLYKYCKDFVNEFEKCEEQTITKMVQQIQESKTKKEIKDNIELEKEFKSCEQFSILIHSMIVADFIHSLDTDIQKEIISSIGDLSVN